MESKSYGKYIPKDNVSVNFKDFWIANGFDPENNRSECNTIIKKTGLSLHLRPTYEGEKMMVDLTPVEVMARLVSVM